MKSSDREKTNHDIVESINIKTLLDVSMDAAFLISTDFKLIALNKEAFRRIKKTSPVLKNKPLSYFIGKHLNQFYPAEFLQEVNKFRKLVIKNNKPERFRYNLNGRLLDIIAYPISEKDNPCCNFAVYSRDITKEIEADNKAKQNEYKIRNLVEQMHEGFVIIDKNGLIEYVNRIAYSFTEYSSREMIGKKYLNFIAPEYREKAMYYYAHAADIGNTHFDAFLLTKSGIRKPVKFSVAPILDKENNFIGTHNVITDISELKRNEEILNYQIEFAKKIIEISSSFINIKSSDIDKGINFALNVIGRFNKEERILLYLLREDNQTFFKSHDWSSISSKQTDKYAEELNLKNFPYFAKILRINRIIHVPDIKTLPNAARKETHFPEKIGLKSFIVVPMFLKNDLIGFMGLGSTTPRSWSNNEISLMKMALDVIAIVIGQKKVECELIDFILKRLSEREREFISILSGGYKWPDDKRSIAKTMDVLPGTLDKFMQRIKEKIRGDDLQLIIEHLKNSEKKKRITDF